MTETTVLVTGAAGFIGSRVTHRLALDEEMNVKPVVHTVGGPGTMRIGRLPVDIEQGSILDDERMEELLAGCDAVINCAHGGRDVTVNGTRTLLVAAERQSVDSYIHLSSAVVHGHDASGAITEESPLSPDTDYAKRKAKAEEIVTRWSGDVKPTVFRPCIVYGPHSPWVENPLRELQEGAMLAGGRGEVNQVYVDNLVDAMLAALGEPAAHGEVFLVADEEPISWLEYYEGLGTLLEDHPPIQTISPAEMRVYRKLRSIEESVVPPIRLGKRLLTSSETIQISAEELKRTPWAPKLFKRLPSTLQAQIEDRLAGRNGSPASADDSEDRPLAYRYPPGNEARMQSTHTRISTAKLRETLGWEPRISFEESLELIGEWAAYEELLDGQRRLRTETVPARSGESTSEEVGTDSTEVAVSG